MHSVHKILNRKHKLNDRLLFSGSKLLTRLQNNELHPLIIARSDSAYCFVFFHGLED